MAFAMVFMFFKGLRPTFGGFHVGEVEQQKRLHVKLQADRHAWNALAYDWHWTLSYFIIES